MSNINVNDEVKGGFNCPILSTSLSLCHSDIVRVNKISSDVIIDIDREKSAETTFPCISNINVNDEVNDGINSILNASLSSCNSHSEGGDKTINDVIIDIERQKSEETDNSRDVDLNDDPVTILTKIRKKNPNRPIIGHININFLYSKYEGLKSLIKDKLDVLVVSETKIDESYPAGQFKIEGFASPFRLDRNKHGGGIIIYVNEDIPCKEIPFQNRPNDIEGIFVELNFYKKKWLLFGGYSPKKEYISHFLSHVGIALDRVLSKYDNLLFLGDFNSTVSEESMTNFCEMYDLKNLIKVPTCYKNPDNPTSIDVMLTNRKSAFENSIAIETGLSDVHLMTISVLKVDHKKREPVIKHYRCYKNFYMDTFRNNLKCSLETFSSDTLKYEDFKKIFMVILDKYAPMKKKVIRGNNAPFMTKRLSKEIMYRSKLKNKLNKSPTEENRNLYKKQRNDCASLLKKEKKNYFNNLDLKVFEDNRKFWRTVKPLFSDKQNFSQRDIIIEDEGRLISDNVEVAETLNSYFIDAVRDLNIEPYAVLTDNISTDVIETSQIDKMRRIQVF